MLGRDRYVVSLLRVRSLREGEVFVREFRSLQTPRWICSLSYSLHCTFLTWFAGNATLCTVPFGKRVFTVPLHNKCWRVWLPGKHMCNIQHSFLLTGSISPKQESGKLGKWRIIFSVKSLPASQLKWWWTLHKTKAPKMINTLGAWRIVSRNARVQSRSQYFFTTGVDVRVIPWTEIFMLFLCLDRNLNSRCGKKNLKSSFLPPITM